MDLMKIPVSIICGFLGGGKTTLLNHILNSDHDFKIAIVENEMGEEGIDEEVLPDIDDLVVEMNNGCLCCSIKGDMQTIIKSLKEKRGDDFNYLMIEATGIANPINIAEAFIGETPLTEDFVLDSILCVVDAYHFNKNYKGQDETFTQQIISANKILLNKTDLIKDIKDVEDGIRKINPDAEIIHTEFCKVGIEKLLNQEAFSWDYIEKELEEAKHHHHDHGHHHTHHNIQSVSMVYDGVINPGVFEAWLNHLMIQNPEIYRSKGVLNLIGLDEKVIFQGVYLRFDFHRGRLWKGERKNRLVIIGKNLNPEVIRNGFQKCFMNEEEIKKAQEILN